jgi:cell division protein FtsZ
LLDSNDIYGTKNILLNIISGKEEIRIGEIGEIIETLQEKAGQEADIIWGNGYDESLGDDVSVTILATGFVTNPNQTLQPKKEPEKFELEEEETQSEEVEELVEETPLNAIFDEPEVEENEFEQVNDDIFTVKQKGKKEKPTVSRREKRKKKRKEKVDEPVTDSNIDSWFYKNFGKLFNDTDDQAMD